MTTVQDRVSETKTLPSTIEKAAERQKLDEDVKAFLDNGGKIINCDTGKANFMNDLQKGNAAKNKRKYGQEYHIGEE